MKLNKRTLLGQSKDIQEVLTIAELTAESKRVNVHFKVLRMEEPRVVHSRKRSRPYLVANAVVADSTACITLTLWNEEIDRIDVGDTYLLTNAYIRMYEECMFLNLGQFADIEKSLDNLGEVNDSLDMSRPFMGRKTRVRKERSKKGRSLTGKPGRETRGYCGPKGF